MHFPTLFGDLGWSSRVLWCTSLEAVGEFAGDGLEVTHASGTGGLPPLCLLTPVVYSVHVSPCSCPSSSTSSLDRRIHCGRFGDNVHFRVLAAGYPHDAQVCFWMWRDRRPEQFECQSSIVLRRILQCFCSTPTPSLAQSISESNFTNRNVCTTYVSCCYKGVRLCRPCRIQAEKLTDAFRNFLYLSLYVGECVSRCSEVSCTRCSVRVVGEENMVGRTYSF